MKRLFFFKYCALPSPPKKEKNKTIKENRLLRKIRKTQGYCVLDYTIFLRTYHDIVINDSFRKKGNTDFVIKERFTFTSLSFLCNYLFPYFHGFNKK